MALTDKLTAIGDAIREKTGSTDALTLDQMVSEIEGITVGGGGDGGFNETSFVEGMGIGCETYTNDRISVIIDRAFYGEPVLKHLIVPNLTEVASYGFYGANVLETVSSPNLVTIGSNGFDQCKALTSVDVSKVTTINTNCFYGCPQLKKLDFASLNSNVKTYAFYNCTNLNTLIFRSPTVLTLDSSYAIRGSGIYYSTGYIYVPDDLVEDYKVATNWANFANQIKPLSEYVEVTE